MGTQIEILDLDTMTDEELGIQFTIEWVRVNFHDANSWFLGILEEEIEDRINHEKTDLHTDNSNGQC